MGIGAPWGPMYIFSQSHLRIRETAPTRDVPLGVARLRTRTASLSSITGSSRRESWPASGKGTVEAFQDAVLHTKIPAVVRFLRDDPGRDPHAVQGNLACCNFLGLLGEQDQIAE